MKKLISLTSPDGYKYNIPLDEIKAVEASEAFTKVKLHSGNYYIVIEPVTLVQYRMSDVRPANVLLGSFEMLQYIEQQLELNMGKTCLCIAGVEGYHLVFQVLFPKCELFRKEYPLAEIQYLDYTGVKLLIDNFIEYAGRKYKEQKHE